MKMRVDINDPLFLYDVEILDNDADNVQDRIKAYFYVRDDEPKLCGDKNKKFKVRRRETLEKIEECLGVC